MRPVVSDAAGSVDARPGARRPASLWMLALGLAAMLSGCESLLPYVPPSEGHISTRSVGTEPEQAIPPPARVSSMVPPPKAALPVQTYSVVVNEVPVKELLLALARDTKQNIDIHPTLSGIVSLNAINETLPAILERISKQVNMRYRTEGNTIVVSLDVPYVKTYRVDYVNMTRETSSTIGVSGELTVSGGGAAAGGGAGGASGGTSGSNTSVRTTSRNDFWDQLRDNIRSILNSTRLQSLTAEARAERVALVRQEQDLRARQIEAASRAGQGAPALAATAMSGAPGAASQQQVTLLPDDVIVNPVSGTVTVNATEKQHQLVQQHLDSIINAVQRQVLIEATIVEVSLSNAWQTGIDWSRISGSGGIEFSQALIGTRLGTPPFASLVFNRNNARAGDIGFTLKLLEQFGNTRVLSSPKLMALNNQTALLKVVDNIVYFEVSSSTSQGVQGSTLQSISTTAKTVAVGVVMTVTPQINEDGRVLLTVRPTVTRLRPEQPFVADPNPLLTVQNLVPQIQVREMESVLQVGSGQAVILGGLMQDDARRNRDQIPGVDRLEALGELFRFRDERVAKTELVIFLRPTIVTNPSLESDDLKFFQRFLPQPDAPPQTPQKAGAAR